jgi:hypothetical protein
MSLTVQLGRAGDLMSILPMLWKEAQSGAKPKLMVAAEFAPLLEGVSYVEPVIFNGPHFEIDKAMSQARAMDAKAVCAQVNGPVQFVREFTYKPAGQVGARSTSFEKEMWKVAGKLPQWDECWPLVFDKRDPVREEALLRKHDLIRRGKQKPLMLLALNSNSSPFPYADLLRELVTLKFCSTWNILELPHAERIYDLLALYERASLLITVDSAPLHLAWACRQLPVFALAQDKPILWHGSSWRPNHLWYCRYRDWPRRAMEMVTAIQRLESQKVVGDFVTLFNSYDSVQAYEVSPQVLPLTRGICGRDSGLVLKDTERHPYLKDSIRMALQRAANDSTEIILSRPQVKFQKTEITPPFYAYRIVEGQYWPIADLFCATKKFWKEALPSMPDFVLNSDYLWSEGLRVLFQSRGAKDATGSCEFVK